MQDLINELIKATAPPKVFPPPGDFHSANTAAFFTLEKSKKCYNEDPVRYKEEFRGVGKVAGLALVYGSSWKLFLSIIPGCTEAMAHQLYDGFFSNLPVFNKYDKAMLKYARKTGYIKTFLQRVLYIDTLHHEKWSLKAKGEREVKNYPIQGAGSEIIKYMLLKIFNFIDKYDLSRWKGTYLWNSGYYTRVLSIPKDLVTDDLVTDLEARPNGNCKVLVMDGDTVIQEFDRSVQMTAGLVRKHNLRFVL